MTARTHYPYALAGALLLFGPTPALPAASAHNGGRLEAPAIPALELFNPRSAASEWRLPLLHLAEYAASIKGSDDLPEFGDFARWAPILDERSPQFNPGLLGPVLTYLNQHGNRDDLQRLTRLSPDEKPDPNLGRTIFRLMDARNAASDQVVVAILSIDIKDHPKDADRVSDFLGALQASGIYNHKKIAAARLRALGLSVSLASALASRASLPEFEEKNGSGKTCADSGASFLEGRDFVVEDPATRQAFRQGEILAGTDRNILILGETGVGKDVLARLMHSRSAVAHGPFVAVNAAAIPPGLFEKEVFGHRKGAFTDARADWPGLLERASGGTLFLDEIGELPLDLQAKLLRVFERGTFNPVGAPENVRDANVRLIAATNRNLRQMIAGGKFLQSLFDLLGQGIVEIRPLRERVDDIPALAKFFLRQISEDWNLSGSPASMATSISLIATRALKNYPWPGNVRELAHAVEHGLIMCEGEMIQLIHLPDPIRNFVRPQRREAAEPAGNETVLPGLIQSLELLRGISWTSQASRRMLRRLFRVAERPSNVIISGPSGAGKSEAARALHLMSGRTGPFLELNLSELSPGLFESELFGHVKGAYTGAIAPSKGYLERAADGTLVLDHIDLLSPELQSTLLRVLEERKFIPVGGNNPVPFRARVVAVGGRNLAALVAEGKFREDLYHRLSGFEIEVPSLKDRQDEIPILANRFLSRPKGVSPSFRTTKRLLSAAVQALQSYDWPGNVRELENVIYKAYISSEDSPEIRPEHLDNHLLPKVVDLPSKADRLSIEDVEQQRILLALLHLYYSKRKLQEEVSVEELSNLLEIKSYILRRRLWSYFKTKVPTPDELSKLAKDRDILYDPNKVPEDWSLESAVRDHIRHVVSRSKTFSHAVQVLGVHHKTLPKLLDKFGIARPS